MEPVILSLLSSAFGFFVGYLLATRTTAFTLEEKRREDLIAINRTLITTEGILIFITRLLGVKEEDLITEIRKAYKETYGTSND